MKTDWIISNCLFFLRSLHLAQVIKIMNSFWPEFLTIRCRCCEFYQIELFDAVGQIFAHCSCNKVCRPCAIICAYWMWGAFSLHRANTHKRREQLVAVFSLFRQHLIGNCIVSGAHWANSRIADCTFQLLGRIICRFIVQLKPKMCSYDCNPNVMRIHLDSGRERLFTFLKNRFDGGW